MTLEQLKVLVSIVQNGSFRAASEALHRSQSALSVSIRKLEEELGFPLFSREHYRPQLTEHGRALYKKAQVVLDHAEDFSNLGRHFSQGEEAELRLTVAATVNLDVIIPALQELARFAPATQLIVRLDNLAGVLERIEEGEADIAISGLHVPADRFERVHLTTVEFGTFIAPTASIKRTAGTLSADDLRLFPQIVVRDSSTRREKITRGVLENALYWSVDDFHTKKKLILAGLGWGRLPMHMVDRELEQDELTLVRSDEFPIESSATYLIRNRKEKPGPVAQKLWQLIRDIEWPPALY